MMNFIRDGFAPNVVATKVGTRYPASWVVIGAHYDSRGRDASSSTEVAPGANDDGSGLAAIVEMARITQAMGATYDYSLMIVGFAAEEQGLVGSNALSQEMLDNGAIFSLFPITFLTFPLTFPITSSLFSIVFSSEVIFFLTFFFTFFFFTFFSSLFSSLFFTTKFFMLRRRRHHRHVCRRYDRE